MAQIKIVLIILGRKSKRRFSLINIELRSVLIFIYYLLDYVHALDDLAENYVLAVEPGGLGRAYEELGPVGVGTGVGHRQNS